MNALKFFDTALTKFRTMYCQHTNYSDYSMHASYFEPQTRRKQTCSYRMKCEECWPGFEAFPEIERLSLMIISFFAAKNTFIECLNLQQCYYVLAMGVDYYRYCNVHVIISVGSKSTTFLKPQTFFFLHFLQYGRVYL